MKCEFADLDLDARTEMEVVRATLGADPEFQELGADSPEEFVEDAQALAREWIIKFFADKEMYCGGPISERILLSPHYIKLVLDTDISVGSEVAYIAMEVDNKGEFPIKLGGISDDVRWVIGFLGRCGVNRVPPCFIGGLMLMYLELCDGIRIPKGLI